MDILAIESSCDDTAVAIVRDGREVLASEVFSQTKRHEIFGGVVPEVASRCHLEAIAGLAKVTLEESGLKKENLSAVAVTYAPGLIGSLLVGVSFAKGISLALDLPLIAVHHLKSHVAANYISNKNLKPPFICLIASGGHTNIVEVKSYTEMRTIGKTRDDAAGETFDKAARCMGVAYPGGVHIDKLAQKGDEDAFEFPIPNVKGSAYDFSFSGLKTSVINKIHTLKQKNIDIPLEDICASLRKSIVSYMVNNLTEAAKQLHYKKIAIAGGVSANSLLRRELRRICDKSGWELFLPDLKFCSDNAAMVGSQGYYEFTCGGNTSGLDLNAYAGMSLN